MFKRVLFLTTILAAGFSTLPVSAATSTRPMGKPDADLQSVLDAQATLNPVPIETLSAAEARKQPTPADGVKIVLKDKGQDPNSERGIRTDNIQIPEANGNINARIYTPKHADPKKLLPVIVYYHGGGFVIADLDTYDATPRGLAKSVDAIVVSADYRHAPESKFPASHDDAFAAYQWVLQNAETFGGDPKRVALVGESTGGNLAINVAIQARELGSQMPVAEVLLYPMAGIDMMTRSYQENAAAKPLNKPMMAWFFNNEVNSDADLSDPRLDIVGKADLHGLPPTTVITAQIDPLRSEGEALADKLKAAGVKTDAKMYTGMTHEFFGMGLVVSKAKDAESRATKDLKAAFSHS